jgi:hypothetical protein
MEVIMKLTLKSLFTISALSAVAIAPMLLSAGSASAQAVRTVQAQPVKGTNASYVGAGVAAGVTNGGQGGDEAEFGGTIQGRFALPKVPVSVRGAVLFSDETSAIAPMVTVDVPVARNTNVYVGGGASLVEADGQNTPLGNRDSFAGVVGVESQFGQNIVGYSDVKVGLNAYENSSAEAVSVQAGVGIRF